MKKAKKWIIEFTWQFIATVVIMYLLYKITGAEFFHMNSHQVYFFIGYSAVSATTSILPKWRMRSHWRIKSYDSFGNTYTKHFTVQKRVAIFFWKKWYESVDEQRVIEIYNELKSKS